MKKVLGRNVIIKEASRCLVDFVTEDMGAFPLKDGDYGIFLVVLKPTEFRDGVVAGEPAKVASNGTSQGSISVVNGDVVDMLVKAMDIRKEEQKHDKERTVEKKA